MGQYKCAQAVLKRDPGGECPISVHDQVLMSEAFAGQSGYSIPRQQHITKHRVRGEKRHSGLPPEMDGDT